MRTLVLALLAAFTFAAQAQNWPTRQVTIVVPYPPGGLIDLVARILQPRLQQELGQSVVVENRSGAGGNVGAESVARSGADGHTILLGNPSLGISPLIYDRLNYRPQEDLAYVGRYGTVPNVLLVNPGLKATTVKDLVAHIKANPGRLNYASNGFGTSPQMSMEMFKAMTNTFIVHIPFRGSAPAVSSVLGGETQMMFDNLPPVIPQIKAGKLRALGVTSLARSAAMPELPTLDESGLKGFEVTSWFGLNVAAATPREIVMRLNQALNRSTSDPKVREQLESRGASLVQETPDDYMKFIRAELAKWGPIVKRAGVKAE
ncbi:MAG: tripartite tricarboxylate transporter substrate binding protein [Burkholderiales bacterium]|nr:tripartite tricarboxylate transporter substrate binding protein [Burkholderiales bacterium]